MAFQEGFNPFGGINKANSGSGGDSGSGGGGAMVVTTEINESGTQITSHTAGQIFDAIQSGKTVVVHIHSETPVDAEDADMYLALVIARYFPNGSSSHYQFSCLDGTFYADSVDDHPMMGPIG